MKSFSTLLASTNPFKWSWSSLDMLQGISRQILTESMLEGYKTKPDFLPPTTSTK